MVFIRKNNFKHKKAYKTSFKSDLSNKSMFLRKLISNSSRVIDKRHHKVLVGETISFNKDDYYIKISVDKIIEF